MIRETKYLLRNEMEAMKNKIIEEFPNANEWQLEDEVDKCMKEHYVDTFTQLFKNNLCFSLELLKTDLYNRVYERKLMIENEMENESEIDLNSTNPTIEKECQLILDAVTLSREYIEELF